MNLTKLSRPCSHFGITIFEQEEGKRGIPLYQTWHIVNSITLYHIKSQSIMSYQTVSHPIILSYQIVTSYSILSYPIVSYPILSYLITSHQTTTYQIHRHHYITTTLQTAIWNWMDVWIYQKDKQCWTLHMIKSPFYHSRPISGCTCCHHNMYNILWYHILCWFMYNFVVTYYWLLISPNKKHSCSSSDANYGNSKNYTILRKLRRQLVTDAETNCFETAHVSPHVTLWCLINVVWTCLFVNWKVWNCFTTKMTKLASFLILFSLVFGQIEGDDVFRFANVFGSHMVLQQAPKRSSIWGYGEVGQEVVVLFSGEMYRSFVTEKTEGNVWCNSLMYSFGNKWWNYL